MQWIPAVQQLQVVNALLDQRLVKDIAEHVVDLRVLSLPRVTVMQPSTGWRGLGGLSRVTELCLAHGTGVDKAFGLIAALPSLDVLDLRGAMAGGARHVRGLSMGGDAPPALERQSSFVTQPSAEVGELPGGSPLEDEAVEKLVGMCRGLSRLGWLGRELGERGRIAQRNFDVYTVKEGNERWSGDGRLGWFEVGVGGNGEAWRDGEEEGAVGSGSEGSTASK